VVLFNAGRDVALKRLDLAQAAFKRARAALPNLRLEILRGDTPPERMPLVMNAADCLLLTSDAEGSPTVVQEALASNLPVVSVDVGDVAERLAGLEGTRIAPRDPDALARTLIELLAEPGRARTRERARELSAERIARELAGLYRAAARV
jgi:glycosyltransferase involved in cell wall biosynthesis